MRISAYLLLFLSVAVGLYSCKDAKQVKIDPAFAEYVAAFTNGTVSIATNVRLRLNEPVAEEQQLQFLKSSAFKLSPDVHGVLAWEDEYTLIFNPDEDLDSDQEFVASVELDELITVPSGMEKFQFSFRTIPQNLDVKIREIRNYKIEDMENLYLTGNLDTWDVASSEKVEATLRATQNGKELPLTWNHDLNRKVHSFIVDSISRTLKASEVELSWNGEQLQTDNSGELSQEIPSLDDFKILKTSVVHHPEQYVEITFSDPLKQQADIAGLVSIAGYGNLRTLIDANILRVYTSARLAGEYQLDIHKGIKNILGFPLESDVAMAVMFEEMKPEIRLITGNSTILPSTDGLVFPFEAVSLAGVDLKIIKIYEDNVHQFLQVNQMNGANEIKRSGRIIAKKTIRLDDGKTNLAQWNRFYLDLDDLIEEEPGAIYRIELGMRKSLSIYACTGESTEEEAEEDSWDEASADDSYWDFFDEYYYDDYYYSGYYYDYDYGQRDNPCDKAYYVTRQAKTANLLASDLGVIIKQGNDGSINAIVSDLISCKPLQGAEVKIMDYQHQELGKAMTSGEGMCSFKATSHKPFLAEVSAKGQKAYIKLLDGNSLALSKFDVSGNSVRKGLKGFIYGERGVWRPGDTLFLGFMLQDRAKSLPSNHPIVFELIDARGKTVEKKTVPGNSKGIYPFHATTDPEAVTGNWQLRVRAGGEIFTKNLAIETIKPNRLKIAIDFDKEVLTAGDQSMNGKIQVNWLHGAPASNLRAEIKSTFSPIRTTFKTHTDFNFDDPVRKFTPEESIIFDEEVNENGEASLVMNAELGSPAPGMLMAYFNSRVFEKGGEFSVDRFSIPYSPYDHYVGIRLPKGDKARGMLLTDEDQEVNVICLDSDGKPAANRELSYEFYKVEWKWWWEQFNDNMSQYSSGEGMMPLATGTVKSNSKGEANFPVRVNFPDWGRYLVRVIDNESGHSTGSAVYIDWPGWAGRAERENPGGASMLLLSADKEKYNVGEQCELSFPSGGIGRALVSIESGSKVIEAFWVESEEEQTKCRFKITEEMSPNVYANITLIQPHGQKKNDLPIRMFGIVPIKVDNPNTLLNPKISMAEVLEPEKKFEVKVSESSGKAMTYTLAVVDEGLLDITRFKTPDAWSHFYSREALGVKTWDMYDDVVGAYGSDLQRLLAIGGGAELDAKGKNKVNRFKPVVMYLGPFELKAGKTASHQLTMPNYIGSVRAMVVATNTVAFGSTEKTAKVKTPLMVLSTLPRVLSPGEQVKLPVTVFAMEDNIKDVQAEVIITGPLGVLGSSKKSIKFKKIGDQIVNFDLEVKDFEGKATVKVIVSSGKESAHHSTELLVSNPNPFETKVSEKVIANSETQKMNFDLFGMAGSNEAYVELSGIPPVDFGSRLQYLLSYPHGCVEQTTSKAFPQLYLSEVMDLNPQEKARQEGNIRSAIQRLMSFQNNNGGLSYWSGSNQISDWGTTYAGHFILEAEKKGYAVNSNFKNAWVAYQKENARNWRAQSKNNYSRSDLEQAYRLYTLALAGQPEIGAMNRLKEINNGSTISKWTLACAYALSGKTEVAREIVNKLSTQVDSYTELSGTFGSSIRDQSMMVEAMILLDQKERVAPLIKEIATGLNSSRWYSTQSTAYGLLAISKYAGGMFKEDVKLQLRINGNSGKDYITSKAILKLPLTDLKKTGNSVEILNRSKIPLYAKLVVRGQPISGNDTDGHRDLELTVNYTDMDGKAINVSSLEPGTDFIAQVSVRHMGLEREIPNIALSQVFPSGWEILNTRLDEVASVHQSDRAEYQDIRDDRVLSYFSLRKGQAIHLKVLLNAAYQGKYYLPAVNCEAMYDASKFARKAGQWVEVKESSNSTANNKP